MIYNAFNDWLIKYWWIILLGLLGLGLVLLISYHIFALGFALSFKHKLRKQSQSINLLIAQRREIALEIVKLALEHDLEISRDDIKGINRLERIADFQALKKEERDERVFAFAKAIYNVQNACNASRKTSNDKRYEPLIDFFNGVEQNYRQKVAKYNSDVLGYNYWVRLRGCKFFFKVIMNFKTKDLLV